jgi:hypothetical protein
MQNFLASKSLMLQIKKRFLCYIIREVTIAKHEKMAQRLERAKGRKKYLF